MHRLERFVAHFTPENANSAKIYLSDTEADTISYVAKLLDIEIEIQELS